MSSRLVVSRSWFVRWYLSGYDYKLHHTLGTMYPKCGDAVTRERVGKIVDLKCLKG